MYKISFFCNYFVKLFTAVFLAKIVLISPQPCNLFLSSDQWRFIKLKILSAFAFVANIEDFTTIIFFRSLVQYTLKSPFYRFYIKTILVFFFISRERFLVLEYINTKPNNFGTKNRTKKKSFQTKIAKMFLPNSLSWSR